ncbi:hypothetical protein AS859_11065, partial [Aliarcobacter cryaerophilus]
EIPKNGSCHCGIYCTKEKAHELLLNIDTKDSPLKRICISLSFSSKDVELKSGDKVSLLPPVCGG